MIWEVMNGEIRYIKFQKTRQSMGVLGTEKAVGSVAGVAGEVPK